MKLTYLTLSNASAALNEIVSQQMNYRTSLKISKNIKAVQAALTDYQEEMNKLMDKYVEKDENGNFVHTEDNPGFYKLIPETAADFSRDRDELNHFEVETEIYKISPEEMEQIKISPSAIVSMEFMIGTSEEERN
ncbi:MAG: hypothetical protein HFG38_10965 [Eubacterium sp.]|jgi:hypothetical protein|nr:hypothetical protein [Eubacterium sp.]